MPPCDVSSLQETDFPWIVPRHFLKEAENLAKASYTFALESSSFEKVEASWDFFQLHLKKESRVYGTHTHFGAQVDRECETNHSQHQKELIRFLQVGVGPCFKEGIVRRALRLQAKKMAQGFSGISPQTLRALVKLSNEASLPLVPREGSLGASGDLIPMAHALGSFFETLEPGPRDGLALVNTNAIMVSHALDLFIHARTLLLSSLETTVKILVATDASEELLEVFEIPEIKEQRPKSAQIALWMKQKARELREGIPKEIAPQPQPRYSLRCSPIVYGLVFDLLDVVEDRIELEYEALADNPVITQPSVYHSGLFYALYLASASDQMMEALARVAEMLDREVLLLMDPTLSGGLSPNLEYKGASHCKGLHQLISSLYQRIRSFGVPSWQMSFSAESNNQDILPAAMQGWNRIADMLPLFESLLKAAQFCANRALDLRMGRDLKPLESWNKH